MVSKTGCIGALPLRLLVVLSLLGWTRMSSAAGIWSVISLPQQPGEVHLPVAAAADPSGNLYVVETGSNQIRERDAQGNWSVIASSGSAPGQVHNPTALAADSHGNLYVAEISFSPFTLPVTPSSLEGGSRIQMRDARGNWSVIAPVGTGRGQAAYPFALAADSAGNLYVAEWGRIQKRDAQGHWSTIAGGGSSPGQIFRPFALVVDASSNLYVADVTATGATRIQKEDAQASWSVIATYGTALSQVSNPTALAVDTKGNLYLADATAVGTEVSGRVQERDAQGNWTIIATSGSAPGQIAGNPSALAAGSAGNLYVVDRYPTDGGRIQKRDSQGSWSVLASDAAPPGQLLAPSSLAVDAAGNIYVAEEGPIQQRDALGNWSVVAADGGNAVAVDPTGVLYVAVGSRVQQRDALEGWSNVPVAGEVAALAVDREANLYVAVSAPGVGGLLERDRTGTWSVLAAEGQALGHVYLPTALSVDAGGNLFVADSVNGRIQQRDAAGSWSVLTTDGPDPGRARFTTGLAVDTAGNLYVADYFIPNQGNAYGRVLKRDRQANWTLLGAGEGTAPGQFHGRPSGLAVDAAGNLYVADTGNNRVEKYTPSP